MTADATLPRRYGGVIERRGRGNKKSCFVVTGIARCTQSGNMPRRLAAGEHTIVTDFATRGQRFENTAHMAGLTSDFFMLAFQGIPCGDMVKSGGIVDGCRPSRNPYVGRWYKAQHHHAQHQA